MLSFSFPQFNSRPQKAVEAVAKSTRTKIESIVAELNEMRNAVQALTPTKWKLSIAYQLRTPSLRLKNGTKFMTYICESGNRSKEQDPSLIIDPPNHSLFATFLATTTAAALAASSSASALKTGKLKKSVSKHQSKNNNNKDDFNDGSDDDLDKLKYNTTAVGAEEEAVTTTAAASVSSSADTEAPKKRKFNSGSEPNNNDDSNNDSNDGSDDDLDKLKNGTTSVGAEEVASTGSVDAASVAATSVSSFVVTKAPKKRKFNSGSEPNNNDDSNNDSNDGSDDDHESTSPGPSAMITSDQDTWSNQSNHTIDAGKRISFQYLSADENELANHDKFLHHLGVYVVNELVHKAQLEQLVKEYFVLVCCKQNPSRAGWANELEFLGEIFVHWSSVLLLLLNCHLFANR